MFLGAHFGTNVTLPNGMIWSPDGRLSWVHEFDPIRNITPTFTILPLATFTVDGPRVARDAVRVDVGSKLAVTPNTALFARFVGEYSNRSQSYAGNGGIKINW